MAGFLTIPGSDFCIRAHCRLPVCSSDSGRNKKSKNLIFTVCKYTPPGKSVPFWWANFTKGITSLHFD